MVGFTPNPDPAPFGRYELVPEKDARRSLSIWPAGDKARVELENRFGAHDIFLTRKEIKGLKKALKRIHREMPDKKENNP